MVSGTSHPEYIPEKAPLLQDSLALGDGTKVITFYANSIHSRPSQHRLDGGLAIGAIASILPNPSLITEPAKTAGMNSITEKDFFNRRNRGSQGWESKNFGEECMEIFRPESAFKKSARCGGGAPGRKRWKK
jgi:hypothetical protein